MFNFFHPESDNIGDVEKAILLYIEGMPGLEPGEFADDQAQNVKEAKAVFSIMNAIHGLSASDGIAGVTTNRAKASNSDSLSTMTFQFSKQYVASLKDNSLTPLLPPAGSATDLDITKLFPGMVFHEGGALEVSEECLIIPYVDIEPYAGGATFGDVSRSEAFVGAIVRAIPNIVPTRSNTVASGLTVVQNPTPLPNTFSLPTNALDPVNPTTTLTAADLDKIGLLQFTTTIAVQFELDQVTQKFDVRVATS